MGAARKLEYYNNCIDEVDENKRKEPEKRKRPKNNKGIVRLRRAVLGILAIGMFLFCQNYQTKLNTANLELDKLNGIIEESKNDLSALEGKSHESISELDVVEVATNRLGMVFPEQDQKIYFSVNVDEPRNEEESEGLFSRFQAIVMSKLD